MAPDLSKPSLAALSHVLRHPEIWPDDFRWFYGDCFTCAMGLASQLWQRFGAPCRTSLAEHCGISVEQAEPIFIGATVVLRKAVRAITPTDIADLIDAYLAKQAQERTTPAVAAVMADALAAAETHQQPAAAPRDLASVS